jgi:3-deoxy-manno-octulosonate cytidylyltransferase (CMP-KDO synthetase)
VQNRSILGVVPARMGSERLPGKPLIEVAGRPLIEWVWRRIASFDLVDECVVATDSEAVMEACATFGARAVMTSPDHASGTERVAEVAARPEFSGHDIIVNVQGDEPLIERGHVEGSIEQVEAGRDIGTVATPVRDLAAWHDPAVVKVTRRPDGAALYFSRSPIPYRRAGDPGAADLGSEYYLRHIGVYAFRRDALARWVSLPADPIEEIERLEQLRPLRAGLTIGVGVVERAHGGVDTQADVHRVEAYLHEFAKTDHSRSPQART